MNTKRTINNLIFCCFHFFFSFFSLFIQNRFIWIKCIVYWPDSLCLQINITFIWKNWNETKNYAIRVERMNDYIMVRPLQTFNSIWQRCIGLKWDLLKSINQYVGALNVSYHMQCKREWMNGMKEEKKKKNKNGKS